MLWTKTNYPSLMDDLEEPIRNKAIELANALYEDGYDQSRSIAIAICQAKNWASKSDMKKCIDNP